MADAKQDQGDPELIELFERFDGRLISPGGAASLLGVSRQTIHTLAQRGKIRIFSSSSGPERLRFGITYDGPKWSYVPLADLHAYAEQVGRPFPRLERLRQRDAKPAPQ